MLIIEITRILLTSIFAIFLSLLLEVHPVYSQDQLIQEGSIKLSNIEFEITEEELDSSGILENEVQDLVRKEIEKYLSGFINSNFNEASTERSIYKNENDAWREYARLHFNTVKHIFDETRNSLTTLIQYSIIGISVVFATAAFLVRGEFNNFKQVEERFQEVTKDVDEKSKELLDIKEKSQRLKDELEQELRGIDDFKESLKRQYSEVYDFIESEKTVKNKNIIWIFEEKNTKNYGIISDLQRDGFENIATWKLGESLVPPKGSHEFAIYSFEGGQEAQEKLKMVIDFAESFEKEIPIIIFIYSEDMRIDIPDSAMGLLRKYGKFSIATTPSRFKSEFKTLIREQRYPDV